MAIYDKYADSPDRLKLEGQEVTVKLVRNGDGTGTIKWNIPNIAGCDIEDLAYDGIIILVSSRPANYITSSPQNGTYYDADPTFDSDVHSGDSVSVASVVGAFYHDRTTVQLLVTDVLDQTPYYVSAYAVDAQGNYFREGVHAYSIPTDQNELEKTIIETPAFHDIQIDTPEGITPKTLTGLQQAVNYKLTVDVNGVGYEFTDLLGAEMQTYEDMETYLNLRFNSMVEPLLGALFPNEGKYMIDPLVPIVYQWDGSQNVEQETIFLSTDPSVPILSSYWTKLSTGELWTRDSGGWTLISDTAIVSYVTDPSIPVDGAVWFDEVLDSMGDLDTVNSSAWVWENGTWCKKPTIIQVRNPLLPPVLTSSDYWYKETTGVVYVRDTELKTWTAVDPIVWDTDPNTIANGDYWYSTITELAYIRQADVWEAVTNIRYEERNDDDDLDNPVATHYWFIPSEQLLFQRNDANTTWNEINVIISGEDPVDREGCILWWDVSLGIDSLFQWDEINSEWDAVNSFTQSETDPADPPVLEDGTYWYNPDTEVLQKIIGLNCSNVVHISSPYDPLNPPVGFIWMNTTDDTWYIWDGSEYVLLDVIESEIDPFGVSDGIFWFDDSILNLRVSGAWEVQEFSLTSLAPETDTYFFDTINNILYQWDGTEWVETEGIAEVELEFNREVTFDDIPDVNTDLFSPFNDFERFGRDLIRFRTTATGCDQKISVDHTSTLFTQLDKPIINYTPATGTSPNESGPMHRELGVGTDGTPDERRMLHDKIRAGLGAPGIQVELTKQELDECIDNALLMVRKHSSYAFERTYFFLDVFPNQQKYRLTDKCVGFHKIMNINAIYRMRTGFLGASQGTFGGYDIYGYAALQQLYSLGTFDMLSYYLVSSYVEDLQYLFADNIVFDFYEDSRILNCHQIFYNNERVCLDATIERTEQYLITNRYLELWIKKWAISEAKMILSQIRGKFQTLPGPNGSTVLNSQELITQAENEQANLREEILDRSFQDHNNDVNSQFFIG